jgi:hypothetical protein
VNTQDEDSDLVKNKCEKLHWNYISKTTGM